MWIEFISRDESLRDALWHRCATPQDYWRCSAAFHLGERQHLAFDRGLVIFDLRMATEDDRRHFLQEAPTYAGLSYLIVDENTGTEAFLEALPSSVRVDVLPYEASADLVSLRLNYARETQVLEENHLAKRAGATRETRRLARFQGLIDHAPFMLLSLDARGQVVQSNSAALAFFGGDFAAVNAAVLSRVVHADDQSPLLEAVLSALNFGKTFRYDARLRRADDVWRWMAVAGGPTFDPNGSMTGATLTLTDITEEKAAREALQEREYSMRTLADSLPIKIWRADAALRIDYFNKALMDFSGVSRAGDSEKWQETVHPEDRSRCIAEWRRAAELKAPFTLEFRMREAKSGTYRWQRTKAAPIMDERCQIRRWFGATLDIHETRLEAETLAGLYHDLLAINRDKDALLMALSAEMRAPLVDLMSCRVAFPSADLAADDREALDAIFRSTESLLRHVDNLLDLSQMMTGRMTIRPVPTDLVQVTTKVIRSLASAFSRAGIALGLCLPEGVDQVCVDPDRIAQVVWNLLSNALKFTPAGGRVWLSLRRDEDFVVLEVEDTGKGIAPNFLPKVFERFAQEENYWTRQQGGLGLGLAIAEHIVDLHGGHISAASRGRNEGARFEVHLPIHDPGH